MARTGSGKSARFAGDSAVVGTGRLGALETNAPLGAYGTGRDALQRGIKELVKNKFPISCEFGNGAVVPLGQVIVKEDFHVVFEIRGVSAPGLVHVVQDAHRHV